MKKVLFGLLAGVFSVSVYAQLGQLFQSVKDQVTSTTQRQVSQGVQSATNDAMQSATTRAHKVIQSARTPDTAASKEASGVQPAGVPQESQGAKPQ
jgi:hypothetical protein